MAEGAFNQSLVLHVDDDGEREVIGFAPGPAGVAEIELAPGTYLSVDYAEPTTLCSIRTTRAADPRVIAALIGDDATSIVVSTPPTDRPVRIDPGESNRFRTPIEPDQQGRDATRLSRACVLASLAEDGWRHEFARGVAALELAEAAPELPVPAYVIEQLIDRSYGQAVQLLADGLDALAFSREIGPQSLGRIGRMLHGLPRDSPHVLRAREVLRHVDEAERRARMPLPAAARPAPSAASMQDYLPAPISLPVGHFRATTTDSSDVGKWARLIHAGSLELMGLAPMSAVFGETRADVIVSPECAYADLMVDVQAEPLLAASTADAVRRAVRLGRRAVELEVTRRRDAAKAWQRCAEAWQAIGDDRRSTIAMRHAVTERVGRTRTLNDRVQSAIQAA